MGTGEFKTGSGEGGVVSMIYVAPLFAESVKPTSHATAFRVSFTLTVCVKLDPLAVPVAQPGRAQTGMEPSVVKQIVAAGEVVDTVTS